MHLRLTRLKRGADITSTELYAQHTLKLGEDLLAGNGLARFILLNDLRLLGNFLEHGIRFVNWDKTLRSQGLSGSGPWLDAQLGWPC